MMKTYELTYIISDRLTDTELKKEREKIKKLLAESKFIREESWGRKKLAYPILKCDYGYYVNLIFETEPTEIEKFQKALKLEENVLRHLIVTLPKKKSPPKITKKESATPKKKKEEQPKTEKELKKSPKRPRKPTPKTIKAQKEQEEIEVKTKELDKKLEELLKE